MISTIITFAMNALLAALTPEKIKGFITAGAKRIQEYAMETETKSDDFLIPATNLVLAAIDIPGPDGEIDVTAELKKLFNILGDQKDIFIDAGLDWVEDSVEATATPVDDQIVLPLCNLVRKVLNVPDNDAPDNDGMEDPGTAGMSGLDS